MVFFCTGGYPYGWLSGGGGSGGRIAVYCGTSSMTTTAMATGGTQAQQVCGTPSSNQEPNGLIDCNSYSGCLNLIADATAVLLAMQAAATSYTPAAAGTIYTRLGTSTFSESLIADNRGQGSGTRVGVTVVTDSTPSARPLQSVSVLRGARLLLSGGTVNATRGLTMDGSGSLVVGKGATLQLPSVYTLTNANVSVTDGGKLGGVRSLVVGAGAILTLDSTGATAGEAITFLFGRWSVEVGLTVCMCVF